MFVEYIERGLSVIPVSPKGKNPIIDNWSEYCRKLPSVEMAEKWDKGNYNIGLACGPASGVIVLDIDTDDKAILALCPRSPLVRRGAKGEARFFRYDPAIRSQSIPLIDILSDGRQVVIPPSIHPVTQKPYKWLTVDTLENFNVNDLPELDMSFMAQLSKKVSVAPVGRNNKLVDIVTSMRSRGENEAMIVNEIYEWDKNFHTPQLFNDVTEGYKGSTEADARRNAWKFVNNVTRSLIDNGSASIAAESVTITIDETTPIMAHKAISFPRPSGLMGKVMTMIEGYSERDMPNLALGGSISLMSALCSNRFRFNETWPNTYILNLAPTGAGKSFPQRIIKKILHESDLVLDNRNQIASYGGYKSSSAVTKNLTTSRVRLDVIDEVAPMFSQIKGGGLYQAEMLDELCKVWSDSNSRFSAGEYAEREDTASCYNPCINILGSTTIEGIKGSLSKDMTSKGLIPRFLIFSHEEYGKIKDDVFNHKLFEEIVAEIQGKILSVERRESKISVDIKLGPMYDPHDLAPKDEGAKKFFKDIKLEFARALESDMSESMKSMMTRGKEQVMKLALLHCVSNLEERSNGIILEDLIWAKEVFETSLYNSKMFIEETNVDNNYEKDLMKVLGIITKKGKVSGGDIKNVVRRIPAKAMQEILSHLIQMEKIQKVVMAHPKNGTKSEFYVPVINLA